MKKIVTIIAAIALLASCGKGDQGQLVGAKGKKWHPVKPKGMVLIPGGSFVMGKSDFDIAGLNNAPTLTATVRSFYMDEAEITNSQYRQFIHWVRDSVTRQKLAEEAEFSGGGDGDGGGSIQDFAFKNSGDDEENQSAYQQYSMHYDPIHQ